MTRIQELIIRKSLVVLTEIHFRVKQNGNNIYISDVELVDIMKLITEIRKELFDE